MARNSPSSRAEHPSYAFQSNRYSQLPLIRRKPLWMLPSLHELQYYAVSSFDRLISVPNQVPLRSP